MKSFRYNIKSISIILGILVIISLVFFIVSKSHNSESKLIEKDYSINLPENMELEYKIDTIGWFGEGERYFVFNLKKEPTTFISDFSRKKSSDIKILVDEVLKGLDIPEKHLPNWNYEYYWKTIEKNGYLYMIYYPNLKKLIICQNRM